MPQNITFRFPGVKKSDHIGHQIWIAVIVEIAVILIVYRFLAIDTGVQQTIPFTPLLKKVTVMNHLNEWTNEVNRQMSAVFKVNNTHA